MIYLVKLNDKEYEVEVEKENAKILNTTQVSAQNTPAPSADAAPAAPSPVISGEGNKIVSPMPGTILDIKVSEGSKVKKGEILLILEAMKMENEILAPSDGVVARILVKSGASVSTNDPLIIIK